MSLILLFPDLGTPAVGDNDTYMKVSSVNPDMLDIFVEGTLVMRFTE